MTQQQYEDQMNWNENDANLDPDNYEVREDYQEQDFYEYIDYFNYYF